MRQRDVDSIRFHILRADKTLQALEFELDIAVEDLDPEDGSNNPRSECTSIVVANNNEP